jgi:hypothetical protein
VYYAKPTLGAKIEVFRDGSWDAGKAIAEDKGTIKVLFANGGIESLDFSKKLEWRDDQTRPPPAVSKSIASNSVKPEGFTGKSVFSFVGLFAPMAGPLFYANYHAQPEMCYAAAVLAVALAVMTVNSSSGKCTFNKAAESAAKKNVTITSVGNRVVRVLMGSIYLAGAVSYALRGFDDAHLFVSWALVCNQCFSAGVWLSSGANGQ